MQRKIVVFTVKSALFELDDSAWKPIDEGSSRIKVFGPLPVRLAAKCRTSGDQVLNITLPIEVEFTHHSPTFVAWSDPLIGMIGASFARKRDADAFIHAATTGAAKDDDSQSSEKQSPKQSPNPKAETSSSAHGSPTTDQKTARRSESPSASSAGKRSEHSEGESGTTTLSSPRPNRAPPAPTDDAEPSGTPASPRAADDGESPTTKRPKSKRSGGSSGKTIRRVTLSRKTGAKVLASGSGKPRKDAPLPAVPPPPPGGDQSESPVMPTKSGPRSAPTSAPTSAPSSAPSSGPSSARNSARYKSTTPRDMPSADRGKAIESTIAVWMQGDSESDTQAAMEPCPDNITKPVWDLKLHLRNRPAYLKVARPERSLAFKSGLRILVTSSKGSKPFNGVLYLFNDMIICGKCTDTFSAASMEYLNYSFHMPCDAVNVEPDVGASTPTFAISWADIRAECSCQDEKMAPAGAQALVTTWVSKIEAVAKSHSKKAPSVVPKQDSQVDHLELGALLPKHMHDKHNNSVRGSHAFFGSASGTGSQRKGKRKLFGRKGNRRGSQQGDSPMLPRRVLPSKTQGLLARDVGSLCARDAVAREIFVSEFNYVNQLRDIAEICIPLADDFNSKQVFDAEAAFSLWGNIVQILAVNRTFLQQLEAKLASWESETTTMGDLFLSQVSSFTPYKTYYGTYNGAIRLLETTCKKSKLVSAYLDECQNQCQGLAVSSLLITPVQRIPRYRLLLQELRKKTDDTHPDHAMLTEAIEAVSKFADNINEGVRITETREEFKRVCKTVPDLKRVKAPLVKSDLTVEIVAGTRKLLGIVLFTDRITLCRPKTPGNNKVIVVEEEIHLDLCWAVDPSADGAKGMDRIFELVTPDMNYLITCDIPQSKRAWLDALDIEIERYCHSKRIEVGGGFRHMTAKYDGDVYEGEWSKGMPHGHGKLFMDSGNVYEGDFKNAQFHGRGKLMYKGSSGGEYDGEWENGRQHGIGTLRLPDRQYAGEWSLGKPHGEGELVWGGGKYEGNFRNGKFHGRGRLSRTNGSEYYGEWVDDRMHGKGRLMFSKGVYEGEFVKGVRHGHGRMIFTTEDIYDGMWKNGQRHGQGTLTAAKDRFTYTGAWKNDEYHGEGALVKADGSEYRGEWKQSRRHGKGSAKFVGGGTYEGEWADDSFHGSGTLTTAEGTVYEGGWHTGRKSGKGQLRCADGCTFHGEWHQDQKSGKGAMKYANGDKFSGSWVNGRRQGQGVFETADGSGQYIGGWEADKRHGQGQLITPTVRYDGEWVADQRHGQGVEKRVVDGLTWTGVWEHDRRVQGTLSVASGVDDPIKEPKMTDTTYNSGTLDEKWVRHHPPCLRSDVFITE